MLCDRYRPRTTLGVLLSQTELGALRAWLRAGTGGPARVMAPQGAGLTTAVRLLAREMEFEALWLTAGQQRAKHLLADAASSTIAVNGRRKLVVLDDFDALCTDAQLMGELAALAKAGCRVPILCLGHTSRMPKLDDSAKKWTTFKFARPSVKALVSRVLDIATTEGIALTPGDADQLCRAARGDVRSALNAMEIFHRAAGSAAGSAAGAGSAGAAAGAAAGAGEYIKDLSMEGLDIVADLLAQPHSAVADAMRLASLDSCVVPMGLFENFVDVAADIESVALASEYFSLADVAEKRAYASQSWELLDYHLALSVAGPCVCLKRKRGAIADPKKFGIVWSKMYNQCAKAKGLRSVTHARAESALATLGASDLAFVRGIVTTGLERGDTASVRGALAGLEPAGALALMRLWKGEYKASTHAKVKKLLLADPNS
jgi:hypothetical protein